ncbi:2-hydroxyacyl-CoA dehydratase [Desulfallas sp. Bu1-1]|uniref:2-hydroxyacyl-CoA dehydratase subunit D n=1 Tax=Desulfallas sp. Bu1-1 TaxID=2787620 RepID=UPI0018A04FE3|nr:2-hydroxyacyl-CoA dehydratase family protein [Desulfallas sp. Bu1-1]MBF7082850.1 2-hydroxyacyl-CoA dehydratase [Desulfallas sp. Bu1-1]
MSVQETKKANRLKSGKMVNKLVNEYWQDLIHAKENGKLVVYTTGLPIGPFMAAQDMAWIHGEGYGARVAARHEEKEPQIIAERRGYNRELCSYARTQLGCVMFAERGVPDDMIVGPIASEIPTPDAIVTCYPGCSSGPQWDWAIERLFGKKIPWFNVVIPYHYGRNGSSYMSGQEFEEEVAYVKRQFEDLIRFLEELSGRPYNWDKFCELMAVTKKVGKLRMEAMEMCKAKPSPASFFDWSIYIAPVNYLTAWPGTVECLEAVKAEVQERIDNNVSAVPNEKYRLFWEGIMNWNKLGWMADKFASFDACVVAGRYTHLAFWHEPDAIDPENPLEGIAINHLECQLNLGYPITEERMMKLCRDYSIDGVILHGARTCRSFARSHYLLAESLSRKMDISSTMFEGDMVDESFYQDEIVNTRIEALLESLDAKKNR